MIEYNGIRYELKYNLKRLEMIENVTGLSVLAETNKTGGMFSITTLKTYIAYGLKEEGSDVFVPTNKGMDIAEGMILEIGYADVCEAVLNELMDDCPFLFQQS